MKYTKKQLKDNKYEVTMTLDAKEWEEAVEQAYQKNKGKFSVQGFRKGKTPRRVLEKTYGENLFYEDAIDGSFYKYYFDVLSKEKEIQPVAAPDLDIKEISKEKGLTLIVTIQCKPDVEMGEYKGLTIKAQPVKVTKKDVDAEIDKAVKSQVKFVEVKDRAVKDGDIATIDFSGSIDGVKFEGGTATDYDLEIGSHSFIDNFEEQLIGLKVGESKDVKVNFPENYHQESLKGKPAVFAVTVKAIKEKKYPEINDELASSVSEFETVDAWKKDIEAKLKERLTKEAERKQENDLVEAVVANCKVTVPDVMVEQQLEDYIEDFARSLSYQGLSLEGYLAYTGSTIEQLKESRREDAKKTVKTRLVLEQIIEKEKLAVTEEDVEKKYNERVLGEEKAKTIEEIKKEMGPEQFAYFQNSLLLNKMITFLKNNNNLE